MYTYEQRMAAVSLYIKYGKRAAATIRDLGYPNRHMLIQWYREYEQNGDLHKVIVRKPKFSDEQKEAALEFYTTHGRSIKYTVMSLGYPGESTFKRWLNEAYPDREKYCVSGGAMVEYPQEKKEQAVIDLCARNGSAKDVAEAHGVSRVTLYEWKKQLLGTGGSTAMPKRKTSYLNAKELTREELLDQLSALKQEVASQQMERDELQREVSRLQMERDILEAASVVIKKGQGVDLDKLSNREKAEVINALRKTYQLKALLDALKIAKSSYCYQNRVLNAPDKYKDLRKSIRQEFMEGYQSYGYRRIYSALKTKRIVISEKVVRRIMRQENLVVVCTRRRKYNSYVGEVSPAVPNLVQRNFHADAPNKLWLTDITEFQIPAGKVYLSPVIDCFDGLPVSWTIGTSPNANLANTMLDHAIQTLGSNEHPIVHSDRGGHYRWPGWIDRMRDAGLTRSMSKKGCSPDNSACEGFFGRLMYEKFYNSSWAGVSKESFINEVNRYLDWYCNKRIKISLGGLSPSEYRRKLGYLV